MGDVYAYVLTRMKKGLQLNKTVDLPARQDTDLLFTHCV